MIRHPDRISGTVMILLGLFLLYVASPLPFGRLNAPDAGFFPIILASLLTALGVVLLIGSFRAEPFSLEITPQSWAVVVTALALVLYAVVVNRVGFLISTFSLLLLLTRLYGGLSWKTSLLLCVPAVLVVYIGFSELGVPLPRGVLGWF